MCHTRDTIHEYDVGVYKFEKHGERNLKILYTSMFIPVMVILPPFENGGAYCFAPVGRYVGMYVGMSVALNLVQLITQ